MHYAQISPRGLACATRGETRTMPKTKYHRKKKQQPAPYDKIGSSASKEPATDEVGEETLVCSKCSKSVDEILQCENCLC